MKNNVFSIELSEEFVKQREKACKKDKILDKRVEEKIDALRENPYRTSTRIEIDRLKGKRRIHVGPRRTIYYAICEECRELEEEHRNSCYECEKRGDKTVYLMMFTKRKRDYKR